jgi:hypothetical protein
MSRLSARRHKWRFVRRQRRFLFNQLGLTLNLTQRIAPDQLHTTRFVAPIIASMRTIETIMNGNGQNIFETQVAGSRLCEQADKNAQEPKRNFRLFLFLHGKQRCREIRG